MVLYGLALTPLAETIRAAVPTVVQPWYADDAAMAGPITGIAAAQRLLLELGPRRGYFPEPDKSILISPLATPLSALSSLAEFNFRHEAGHRYLGGFVGSGAAEAAWVDPQVQQWIEGVHRLAAAARRYPQTAYAGLSQSLQSEWQYLQRVTPDISPAFAPLEAAIATVFLPALLDASVEEVAKLRPLLALPTRMGGLGIPDPTTTGRALLRCLDGEHEPPPGVTGGRRPPLCYRAQAQRLHRPPRGKGEPATHHREPPGRVPRRLAAVGEAAHPTVGGDRRLALHPAEPPQRLRPLGRGVPRWGPPSPRPDSHLPPAPMRRMRRTLHDGARHVMSQRGADPPPPQRPCGDVGAAMRPGAHPLHSL